MMSKPQEDSEESVQEWFTRKMQEKLTDAAIVSRSLSLNEQVADLKAEELPKVVIGDAAVTNINPAHYRSDPSGVECITVVRHRSFNVGNAIKYLWRAGLKTHPGQDQRDKEIEDLKKARWYLADEIRKLGGDPEAD